MTAMPSELPNCMLALLVAEAAPASSGGAVASTVFMRGMLAMLNPPPSRTRGKRNTQNPAVGLRNNAINADPTVIIASPPAINSR